MGALIQPCSQKKGFCHLPSLVTGPSLLISCASSFCPSAWQQIGWGCALLRVWVATCRPWPEPVSLQPFRTPVSWRSPCWSVLKGTTFEKLSSVTLPLKTPWRCFHGRDVAASAPAQSKDPEMKPRASTAQDWDRVGRITKRHCEFLPEKLKFHFWGEQQYSGALGSLPALLRNIQMCILGLVPELLFASWRKN